ncbi:DNA-binding transcriptional regulator LsrR (DeoR family) [Kribbella sp. VKM Ac-2527]|uniref:DNA-binding transcriptional regulator LsrR (DeoR family) n=1 Tax=Kribbella caucasensis TaxID=2512215 RepID=A0A4R6KP46_9ACTN|nr:sugar-binding transcriptional regulator [Kribbella sp. VKM Ac-2527]TDO52445.1 DNA-binding transcriptional regulator LsrR (DeoR family) [Kribbella sp. VKM Ac-2527]
MTTAGVGRAGGRGVQGHPSADHLRLLTKVAKLYHEQGVRQPQIAAQLHISQPRVSRLLKQAVVAGIVRTVVIPPSGVHTELEDAIEQRYGLREVIVVDASGEDDAHIIPALGAAAAVYLETTLTGGDRIGISSWSSTLLATVESMTPRQTRVAEEVVQILGGVGNPEAQARAARLVGRLADLTGAAPVQLPVPGLVGSPSAKRTLMKDGVVSEVMEAWSRLTLLLVGIGSLEPSPLLKQSGNAMSAEDQKLLRDQGAVGDICLRFFDENGKPVRSELDQRVLGLSAARLRDDDLRSVGVAGGMRKYAAIRAGLLGGWVDVLITDRTVAERLAADS